MMWLHFQVFRTPEIRISCAPPSISPFPCPGRPCPFLFYFMTHTSSNSPPKFLPSSMGAAQTTHWPPIILWGPLAAACGLMVKPCLVSCWWAQPRPELDEARWLAGWPWAPCCNPPLPESQHPSVFPSRVKLTRSHLRFRECVPESGALVTQTHPLPPHLRRAIIQAQVIPKGTLGSGALLSAGWVIQGAEWAMSTSVTVWAQAPALPFTTKIPPQA